MDIFYITDNGDYIGMVKDDCCPAIAHQVLLPAAMLKAAGFHKDTIFWVTEVKHFYIDGIKTVNKSMTSITLSVIKPVIS